MRDPNQPWKNPPPLPKGMTMTPAHARRTPNDDEQLARDVFALASLHVVDWPEAERRLEAARRHVLHTLRAEVGTVVALDEDDLWFATRFLIRALDDDVGLTPCEIVAVLDAIGMPTDAVAMFAPVGAARGSAAFVLIAAATRAAIAHAVEVCPRGRLAHHDCFQCREPDDDDELDDSFDDDGNDDDQPSSEDDDGFAVAA